MPFLPRPALLPALLALALATPLQAQDGGAEGLAGAYLAAQTAAHAGDFGEAAAWYARALDLDPGNTALLESAVVAAMGAGDVAAAARYAAGLGEDPGQPGRMALIAAQAAAGDYAAILAAKPGVGTLFDGLVLAWADLGQGRMSEALAGFDALAATPGLEGISLFHKALALAQAGDFEGADAILSGQAAGPLDLTRRGILTHVEVLSALERNPDAVALLDATFPGTGDPLIDDLRRRLQAGEPLPFTMATKAADGIAETFFTLAMALRGEAEPGYVLIHARAAAWLRPAHTEAVLLGAEVLEEMDQHALAAEVYGQIRPEDPAYAFAEIGRASALFADDRKDEAVRALEALAVSHGALADVQSALGDALRRSERWSEALAPYDRAVAIIGAPERQHWPLFYSRGIVHERLGNFDAQEADMRQALALEPDQPQVLNYLGYGFVDRGVNLDEALAMIERAVAARPDAGYIVDSLAWAYYRLGRTAEALEPMERASLLMPVDPVVTDHLGDIYWVNDRQLEAEFQWRRALSFDPAEKDAARIRRKLEVGLDVVLEEERAAGGTGD